MSFIRTSHSEAGWGWEEWGKCAYHEKIISLDSTIKSLIRSWHQFLPPVFLPDTQTCTTMATARRYRPGNVYRNWIARSDVSDCRSTVGCFGISPVATRKHSCAKHAPINPLLPTQSGIFVFLWRLKERKSTIKYQIRLFELSVCQLTGDHKKSWNSVKVAQIRHFYHTHTHTHTHTHLYIYI